jgi:hypothetical protein
MNLVMFPVMKAEPGSITYTDTDSMAMRQATYLQLRRTRPWLFDDRGVTLGTFKNDHSDIFPNARVMFSALGGKKVKMHVVVCPDTGNVKICNTFKGYMIEGTDAEGRKYSADRAMHSIATSLVDILYDCVPSPHVGTRWTRDLATGVRIEKGVEVVSTPAAYLNHSAAFLPIRTENNDYMVLCVPHGSTPPEGSISTTPSFDMGKWQVFLSAIVSPRVQMDEFLAKYYDQKDDFYAGLDAEEWNLQNDIIDGAKNVVPPSPAHGQEVEKGEDGNSMFAQEYIEEMNNYSPLHMPFEGFLTDDEEQMMMSDYDSDGGELDFTKIF